MKILFLSGWAQPAGNLAGILPDDTVFFDYSRYQDMNVFLEHLSLHKADIVVGWSLGGQLALRAVAKGILKPRKLVLLAVPYRLSPQTLETLRNDFINDSTAMLKRFHALCAMGDRQQKRIARQLNDNIPGENNCDWLFWLDELSSFSCESLDWQAMPETLLIYGKEDRIVPPEQGLLLFKHLPKATWHLLPDCAHAPHLHNAEMLKTLMHNTLCERNDAAL